MSVILPMNDKNAAINLSAIIFEISITRRLPVLGCIRVQEESMNYCYVGQGISVKAYFILSPHE